MLPEHVEALWRFARGDMPAGEFEDWVCGTGALERELGPDLYLRAISGGWRKPDDVDRMRAAVMAFLRSNCPSPCACLEMRDLQVVGMGHHDRQFRTLERVKRRGGPRWWLWMARCTACRQHWLIGSEERQNDNFCLKRMSEDQAEAVRCTGSWPTDFNRYETLIRLGIAAGNVARFGDPMDTRETMADLALERPGIRVAELARLLNLDEAVAADLARSLVRSRGVEITLQ